MSNKEFTTEDIKILKELTKGLCPSHCSDCPIYFECDEWIKNKPGALPNELTAQATLSKIETSIEQHLLGNKDERLGIQE